MTVASSPTQDRVVKSAAQRSRPSEDAINSHLLKTQKKDRADAVYNYRPLFLGGPPITIYHPVFSEFAQAMSVPTDTLEFTIDELEKAKLLMKVSCDRYEDVHARRGDLHDILVGFQSNCSVHYSNARKSSFYFPDGMKVVNCDGIKTCPAFQEIKNEIGMGGSDPMDQCECDYVKSVTSNEYAPIRNASCCPCILIGIAGPNLSINGAVFTESQLVSQRLCDNVYLGPVVEINGSLTHTMRGIRRIAQFVRAYGSAVDKLYTFYKELKLEPIGQVRPPHFDRYTVGQDSFQIIYIERLCPESAAKAVFKATVMNVASEETCTVVVKFAFSYDKQAHELLASHGLSPALKYCERVASVGNLFVVIMEWMSGIPFLQYAHAAMVPTLRTAVKMLHNSGRVFGDLRAPNVLVETDEEETQVTSLKLLDFDWCDYEGSARYPEFTNMDPDLNWHPDTRPFGLIAKAHDVYMFKKLTGMELDKQLRTN
ncbi:hypothetical protein VKT23_011254 [Stygiomarasmius scandens]|uniref:Protein kinase domain-containing protein n=1 Tax=Marasmiellus scandens TaxID=2682957 RepID=A0ABR1JBK4_9AGAR